MFTIRKKQRAAFWASRIAKAIPGLVKELRASFAEELADISDEHLRNRVQDAIMRAWDYGLVSVRDISRLLNLQVIYGWCFDTEHPWMKDYLTDPMVPDPGARLDRLVGACIKKLETEENNARLQRRFGV